jgi:CTP synthase (UTP-ammonia lyase)
MQFARKISQFCGVRTIHIFENLDLEHLHELPLALEKQDFVQAVCQSWGGDGLFAEQSAQLGECRRGVEKLDVDGHNRPGREVSDALGFLHFRRRGTVT